MWLKSLVLRNFRNYSDVALEFPEAINLIVGDNAQGKTNLLEAIYFLSTAKSHRTHLDDELIRHGTEGLYVKGHFESRLSATVVEISNTVAGKKRVNINGKLQTKSSHLIGHANVVIFSPESLALVKGSPEYRRRFLDILISQINPTYLRHLQDYRRVLKQRNELLRQIREDSASIELLASWDEQLVETGIELMTMRADIVAKLSQLAREKHNELTQSSEILDIVYQKSCTSNSNSKHLHESKPLRESKLSDYYHNALNRTMNMDIRRGATSIGPHRDDLTLSINNFDARRFGSQGQHRTIALSLKLAEIELIYAERGELPIVLLDDVASELDTHRIVFLFHLLNELNVQAFVTATQLNNLRINKKQTAITFRTATKGYGSSKGYTIFEINDGIITNSNTSSQRDIR